MVVAGAVAMASPVVAAVTAAVVAACRGLVALSNILVEFTLGAALYATAGSTISGFFSLCR